MLPHEKLAAFWLVDEYVAFLDHLLPKIKCVSKRDADQLDRSGGSMTLNFIEAASDLSAGDKARFFRYSRREVNESYGVLWRHRRKNNITDAELRIGKYYVDRASAMIWSLIKFWEGEAKSGNQ